MTNEQLLDRFLTTNDPDAFRHLVDRHGPMVLAVCRGILRNVHDVDDAFQNTFVSLALRARTIQRGNCIGPWLHRVATRTANRIRFESSKRRARERGTSDDPIDGAPIAPDYDCNRLLRDELDRLPARYRMPVVLCYLEGKSNQEAAVQLQCPVGTIKGRLSRARQTLKVRLMRRGVCL